MQPALRTRSRGAAAPLGASLLAAVIAAGIGLSGCGDASSSGARTGDVAGLFAVAPDRKMYLECRGTGAPTVVLIAGGFEAGWIWTYALYPTDAVHEEPIDGFSAGRGDPQKLASAVLSTASKLTRVCTYDRPNTTLGADIESERHGEISTPVPQPHSAEHDVADLRALLDAAGESGPYVLVAHSYGGLIAELYARTHPEDVVGRVNVDVTSVYLRDTLSPEEYLSLIESTRTPPQPGGEALEIGQAVELIDATAPAPQMPAIVLVADKPPNDEPATLSRFALLLEAQNLLAASLRAKELTRTNSGHHIHVEQPQIVSDATREIVEAVLAGCSAVPCAGVPPTPDPPLMWIEAGTPHA